MPAMPAGAAGAAVSAVPAGTAGSVFWRPLVNAAAAAAVAAVAPRPAEVAEGPRPKMLHPRVLRAIRPAKQELEKDHVPVD